MQPTAELTQLLLDHGANVTAKSAGGRTALMRAAWKGGLANVKLLLQQGVDVNVQAGDNGTTALIEATLRGNIAIVEYLLQHGADVQIKNAQGHTALSLAQMTGNPNIIKLLEQYEPKSSTSRSSKLIFIAAIGLAGVLLVGVSVYVIIRGRA